MGSASCTEPGGGGGLRADAVSLVAIPVAVHFAHRNHPDGKFTPTAYASNLREEIHGGCLSQIIFSELHPNALRAFVFNAFHFASPSTAATIIDAPPSFSLTRSPVCILTAYSEGRISANCFLSGKPLIMQGPAPLPVSPSQNLRGFGHRFH